MTLKDPFDRALEGKTVEQKLQFLYHRRQALDNLIRSLEVECRRQNGEGQNANDSSFWPTMVA